MEAMLENMTYLIHQVLPTCRVPCVLSASWHWRPVHRITQPEGKMRRWPIIYCYDYLGCYDRTTRSGSLWDGRMSQGSGEQAIKAFLPEPQEKLRATSWDSQEAEQRGETGGGFVRGCGDMAAELRSWKEAAEGPLLGRRAPPLLLLH